MNKSKSKGMFVLIMATVAAVIYSAARVIYAMTYFEPETGFSAMGAPFNAFGIFAVIFVGAAAILAFCSVPRRDISADDTLYKGKNVIHALLAAGFLWAACNSILSGADITPGDPMTGILAFAHNLSIVAGFVSFVFFALLVIKKSHLAPMLSLLSAAPPIYFAALMLGDFVRTSSYINRAGRAFAVVGFAVCTVFLAYSGRGNLPIPKFKAEDYDGDDGEYVKTLARAQTMNAKLYTALCVICAMVCISDAAVWFAAGPLGMGVELRVGNLRTAFIEGALGLYALGQLFGMASYSENKQ